MKNKQFIRSADDQELAVELSLIASWSREEFNKASKDASGLSGWMERWLNEDKDATIPELTNHMDLKEQIKTWLAKERIFTRDVAEATGLLWAAYDAIKE